MNFHWIIKNGLSKENLNTCVKEVEEIGCKSALFTFHKHLDDPFIKAATMIDKFQKIKFMVAIRPYSMTPEYCAMMSNSFNYLSNNRLIINIVNGSDDNEAKEFNQNSSIEERRVESEIFSEKLLKEANVELAFSGASKKTIENSIKFGKFNINMLSYVNKDWISYLKNNNITPIIRPFILICETSQEAKKKFELIETDRIIKNTIYGSMQEVLEKINDLKSIGINDLLISEIPDVGEKKYVYDLVRSLS